MKILKQEVKTNYNISFDLSEFLQICHDYMTSMNKHRHPRAFENLDISDEIKVKEVEAFFKEMFVVGNGDLFALIAEHFGFDGWSHAGYYNKAKNKEVVPMLKTTIIVQLDDENNTYCINDKVRIKMKPSDPTRPDRANEYIGFITAILRNTITLETSSFEYTLDVDKIDKIRFAKENETFDNTWDF